MTAGATLSWDGGRLATSPVWLGAGNFGWATDEPAAHRLLDRYVELGGRTIDTAHIYGFGASEQFIGSWLARTGGIDGLVIGTKGCHPPFPEMSPRRVTPDAIRNDLAESLDRLGVNRVPLYWLHRDDPAVPVDELLGALNDEIAAGRIGSIGCSNWTPARQDEARRAAGRLGLRGFCASQIGFSLAIPKVSDGALGERYGDAEARAWHERTQVPVAAYSPLAGGYFSPKRMGRDLDPDHPHEGMLINVYDSPENRERRARAAETAQRLGVDLAAVAVRWVLERPFPTAAIIGPRDVAQLDSAWGAMRIGADAVAELG